MLDENLITMQQYAVKHKMSTFGVVKLVNAKKLKTIKKNVDGEEREYIIDETQAHPNKSSHHTETTTLVNELLLEQGETINYEVEFHKLLAKYIELQEKYTQLIENTKSQSI